MTRIEIAAQLAAGLLASQDPNKGWHVERVCEVSFRIADRLLEMEHEPLPVYEPGSDS